MGCRVKSDELVDEALKDSVHEVSNADSKLGVAAKEVREGLILFMNLLLEKLVVFRCNSFWHCKQFQKRNASLELALKLGQVTGKEEVLMSGILLCQLFINL
jgi:hypothetical protein